MHYIQVLIVPRHSLKFRSELGLGLKDARLRRNKTIALSWHNCTMCQPDVTHERQPNHLETRSKYDMEHCSYHPLKSRGWTTIIPFQGGSSIWRRSLPGGTLEFRERQYQVVFRTSRRFSDVNERGTRDSIPALQARLYPTSRGARGACPCSI